MLAHALAPAQDPELPLNVIEVALKLAVEADLVADRHALETDPCLAMITKGPWDLRWEAMASLDKGR
jgi:hypothetical protein